MAIHNVQMHRDRKYEVEITRSCDCEEKLTLISGCHAAMRVLINRHLAGIQI